ncbi:hypothetical protein HanXRQr2_Chr09g0372861 [Helianthus annuus]|uniref:Uncharacterized protein n=1 Tax=Helianthus annuus TaxID=4232 RepID=A0A9K3N7C3_HELAN|nr:hypothetical protein HanXRQr2_Chr09g0372861 [Helianthus annuus]
MFNYTHNHRPKKLKIFIIAVEYQRSPDIFNNHRRISTVNTGNNHAKNEGISVHINTSPENFVRQICSWGKRHLPPNWKKVLKGN